MSIRNHQKKKPHKQNHNYCKNSRKNSRDKSVWIYGKHACLAAIKNPKRKILRILVTKTTLESIQNHASKLNIQPEIIDNKNFAKFLSDDAVHQGIAVEAALLPEINLAEMLDHNPKANLIVILDQVTDPHNVGAVLRSAAAFDVDAVIIPESNSPSENATMAKVSSGALEFIPLVRIPNLVATIKTLKEQNFWIIGLDGSAKLELGQAPEYDKVCMVLGAEGKGLRRLTAENCDLLTRLKISDKVESLNVSNAATIAMYEVRSRIVNN